MASPRPCLWPGFGDQPHGWAYAQCTHRRFTGRFISFAPITTTKLRVFPQAAVDNGYSRLTEVEAWGSVSTPAQTNVALRSNGAVVTASSEFSAACDTWPARGANDGDRKGAYWGGTGGWADASVGNFTDDWLQIEFSGSKTIHEIDVFTLQDNYANPVEPTESTTFSTYGLTAYDVSYWNGTGWVQIPETVVTGNNKIWRRVTFSPITITKIRVYGRAAIDNGHSRIVEVEAWSATQASGANGIQWLVSDQLGTPRMILDQTGSLAGMKRHDYLPFGEELFAPLHGRTVSQGYASGDGIRQQFTAKERDIETGFDYFGARYYNNIQGRFVSPDVFSQDVRTLGSGQPEKQALVYADASNPQSLNKYHYTFNNPLRYVDPDGHMPQERLEIQIRRDEKEFAEGKITRKELLYRARARGAGGVVGAVTIGVILAGRQAMIPILIWSARNPDKVQSAAYALQELMGGPPGIVTGVSRMTKAELSMAEYLAARGHVVEKLAVVAQAGVKNPDFLINGVKVELKSLGADALGSTLKNRIAEAVGQGGGNVLIDARAAKAITQTEAEKAAARVFGADSRLNVVRIVGQDFDITIARQAQ